MAKSCTRLTPEERYYMKVRLKVGGLRSEVARVEVEHQVARVPAGAGLRGCRSLSVALVG